MGGSLGRRFFNAATGCPRMSVLGAGELESCEMGLSGECLCGEIRYECSAEPIAAYLCHCHDCQRASGGPYAACTMVARDAFELISGKTVKFERPGDSGQLVIREFCGRCGSQLFSHSPARPDWIVIRSGTLDDSSPTAPMLHIWTASALGWALPDDGTPRHAQGPPR